MAIKAVLIDTVALQGVLNKSEGDVVLAKEWNLVHQTLVAQQNEQGQQIADLSVTIDDILNGRITGLVVDTDVTSFGGHPVADFVLHTQLNTTVDTINNTITTGLAGKLDKVTLTASRAVTTNASGILTSTEVSTEELSRLKGVTSAVQTQLNDKLGKNSVAYDTARINGKRIFVQTSAPTSPSVNDIWISW